MKIGSLFTGYGGLDMAIGGNVSWYSEIDKAACTILESHCPNVSNIGDITKVKWDEVEPVDIITGGYPCQPFSQAGLRKGENDERHLWPYVRNAINTLRPDYAILENVYGHITLGFASVLADLATIGYDAEWGIIRASDVGAPHRRKRLFILAYPNSGSFGHNRHKGYLVDEVTKTSRQWAGSENISTGSGSEGIENKKRDDRFGPYLQAIEKWELVTKRKSPEPIMSGKLNPVFVEWMMGLPEGHVTGRGLRAAQELKMLGNGVVPQQASEAINQLAQRII